MKLEEQLFIRHAHTPDSGVARFDSGDPGITSVGMAQSQDLRDYLAQSAVGLEVVVCSPKLRARQTAAIALQGLGIPLVEHPGLIELGWGSDQGRPIREVFTPELDAQARTQNYDFRLNPTAETLREGHDRVDAVVQEYRGVVAAFIAHSWLIKGYFGVQHGQSRDAIRGVKIANTQVTAYIPGGRTAPLARYRPTTVAA